MKGNALYAHLEFADLATSLAFHANIHKKKKKANINNQKINNNLPTINNRR
jgi:hypothetical protein